MTEWWICPWDNEVVIDDAPMHGIDCSAIPKNVYLIWWYPLLGCGEILYHPTKDRLGIREQFTDFTPLVDLFNAWIRAAQKNSRLPSITLLQARFVKLKMLDALLARGSGLNLSRYQTHKDIVARLTTVDEIADYDITEGW